MLLAANSVTESAIARVWFFESGLVSLSEHSIEVLACFSLFYVK